MFSPLSCAYSAALADFMDMCQGLSSITKRDFFRLFYIAWDVSFHSTNILKSFRCTGLSPFDPRQILDRFQSDHGSRPFTSDSTTSVISASDWRKIERLLRGVVEDMYDREAKKLSQTIHTIAVQKTLLQHENERLREALINEKKRPRLWNDQKRLKQQLQEERRLGRMAAKVSREEAAAVKAREKSRAAVDRELAKQLQDDLQLSKKSKRQSIKVSKSLQLSELPVATVVDDLVGGEPSASSSALPTTTTRRGRNIILPSKFK
ncbi:hypothetical protein EJ07DRAFT_141682 [Lizonia empirigonia]|nr:hypothetical protein EJ07DRAFT_141682 [Lizonia empirigonia]